MSGAVGSIVAVVVLAVAGGIAERSVALPAPDELVPNTAARVSDVPAGMGTITITEFRHAVVLAAAAEDLGSMPEPGQAGYGRLKENALQSLLEGIWIHGQAAEWKIFVTPRQVSRVLALVKQENFASRAEYRRFLQESHYTRRDVRERVEIQLLSTRLRERLQAQIAQETENESEEQRAFTEFIAEFNARWRARTVCAPKYAIERCSNGPNVR